MSDFQPGNVFNTGFAFSSCAVVGKSFVPAHNTTNYDVILKKPMVKSVPDQWIVWVADSCRVRSVHVEKSTFDTLKHGQFVTSKGFYYGKKTND